MMGAGGTRTQERRSEPPCPQGGLELGQNEGRGARAGDSPALTVGFRAGDSPALTACVAPVSNP